jgi:hypothetical protein
MSRWWKGVALVAAWLGLVGTGRAQSCGCGIPSPVGAARMPEPVSCGPAAPAPPGPPPNLIPGPLTPEIAPPGPPDCLSLPANHTGAFQCENFPPEEAIYASIGTQWLQRQTLGKGAVAVVDPDNLKNGIIRPGIHHDVAERFNDVTPAMAPGFRGTLGYLCNDQSFEVTGFYIMPKSSSFTAGLRGRLDAFFVNPPLGFEGDNGMWKHADLITTTLTSTLGNIEVNYRRWNVGITGFEMVLGVRYFHSHENLGIFTGDDDLTIIGFNGKPDPTKEATYNINLTNNLIAGQFGLEYTTHVLKWLSAGTTAKAGLGPDIIHVRTSLTRGDGFVGFDTSRTATRLGGIADLGAFLDIALLERARLRAGYNIMWLVGVATTIDQGDFNLAHTMGHTNYNGSTMYHGPMLELQFLF